MEGRKTGFRPEKRAKSRTEIGRFPVIAGNDRGTPGNDRGAGVYS